LSYERKHAFAPAWQLLKSGLPLQHTLIPGTLPMIFTRSCIFKPQHQNMSCWYIDSDCWL